MNSTFGEKISRVFAGTIWGIVMILPVILLSPLIVLISIGENEEDNIR